MQSIAVRPGILGRPFRLVTLSAVAIMFLIAFENLAVTTIMPVISRELEGLSFYAVAFAGPIAIGVVGMVVGGNWSDRTGPSAPLVTSVLLFAVGLVIAGTAPNMAVLVLGRLVYGFASGAMTVSLYVVVGRTFPDELQPRIFGAFAAAWILPALVGPAVAGLVNDAVGWRWVFLGVVVFVVMALVMIYPVLRQLHGPPSDARVPWSVPRILWSVLLAAAILGLSLAVELSGWAALAVVLVTLALALLAARALLPPRTFLAARGLPGVIAVRGLLSGAFFGAEVYLPYLLTSQFHLTPTLAGLSLTGSGVAWGIASLVQGRGRGGFSAAANIRVGTVAVVIAIGATLATAFFVLSPWVAVAGWAVGGIGMGMAYPRLSVLVLGYSTPADQGLNSSALTMADSVGPAILLAILGILFQRLHATAGLAFSATFLVDLGLAFVALTMCGRVLLRRTPA